MSVGAVDLITRNQCNLEISLSFSDLFERRILEALRIQEDKIIVIHETLELELIKCTKAAPVRARVAGYILLNGHIYDICYDFCRNK